MLEYVIRYRTADGIQTVKVKARSQIDAICQIHPGKPWELVSCIQLKDVYKHSFYLKFQLHWLMEHGFSLQDLFSMVRCWQDEAPETDFRIYFENSGFGGEIYPCFQEFLNCEYRDQHYMKQLLDPDDYYWYLEDIRRIRRFSGGGAADRLHGEAIKYWCNACGELHEHGKKDITEDQLPDELRYAYQNLWSEGYGFLCYLVETKAGYGITLSYEAADDICIDWIDELAEKLAEHPAFASATMYVGENTGYGGDKPYHELIVVFPATTDDALFTTAAKEFARLVDGSSAESAASATEIPAVAM